MQKKGQLTLPSQIRSRLDLPEGDLVDVKIRAAHIVVTPQVVIDRSKFPAADDEYTPKQRRIIERDLDTHEGCEVKSGCPGPCHFDSLDPQLFSNSCHNGPES
jgi:AbrB family looped-hinge helix DNA binding protein